MEGLEPGWSKRLPKAIFWSLAKFWLRFVKGARSPRHSWRGHSRCYRFQLRPHFYRNAFNMGLPLLEVEEGIEDIGEGDELEIDIEAGQICNLTTGKTSLPAAAESMRNILKAGGLVGYVRERMEKEK